MFSLILQIITGIALWIMIVKDIQSLLHISYRKSAIFVSIFLIISILIIRLIFGIKISLGEWLI